MNETTTPGSVQDALRTASQFWDAGKYEDAEGVLSTAIETAVTTGSVPDEALLRLMLAVTLKYRNAIPRAFAELDRVLALPSLAGEIAERARTIRVSLNYELRRVDRAEQLAGDHVSQLTLLAMAYFKNRQLDSAYATLERVITLAEQAGDHVRALKERYQLAMWRVLPAFHSGKYPVSQDVLTASLAEFDACEVALKAIDSDPARAALRALPEKRAAVLHVAGRFDDAARDLRHFVTLSDADGIPAERARARQLLAILLLARGVGDEVALTEAAALVDEMFALLIDVETPAGLAEAARVAARIDRQRGRATGDATYYRSAIAWLRQADLWLSQTRGQYHEPGAEMTDATRRALHAGALDIYVLAIEILLNDLTAPADAFEWVERVKGSVLAEMVGAAALAPSAGLSVALLADEARALVQLRRATIYADVWEAQVSLDHAWEQLAAQPDGHEYVALRRGTPIRYSEMQALLAAADRDLRTRRNGHVVLIEYLAVGDQLLVFGARSDLDTPLVRRLQIQLSTLQRDIEEMTRDPKQRLRGLLAHPSMATCITPILEWTDPGDIVCIVPAGPLFYVPLHAVPVGRDPLMVRNPVFYAPSATTLRSCIRRRLPPTIPDVPVVFSNPTGDLPAAAKEAAAVAQLLGIPPITGAAVTRNRVGDAITSCTIMHFAGHAFFDRADALASGLVVTGNEIVTARDFFASAGGRMRLVTLSACETGFNDVHPGDELLGLTRAILYAGATSLLVTLWPVADEATAALMRAFYSRWLTHGESKVDALTGAQRDLITAGYSDPYHWAPFTLIGDWL